MIKKPYQKDLIYSVKYLIYKSINSKLLYLRNVNYLTILQNCDLSNGELKIRDNIRRNRNN